MTVNITMLCYNTHSDYDKPRMIDSIAVTASHHIMIANITIDFYAMDKVIELYPE